MKELPREFLEKLIAKSGRPLICAPLDYVLDFVARCETVSGENVDFIAQLTRTAVNIEGLEKPHFLLDC